jgi:pyruvate ferredoxin oxidoreductase gamma subunit
MSNEIKFRWHGRGGQGVKTAALLLADVAFTTGKYVKGFPEYGPERMGAPVTAYDRISDEKIMVHSNIYEPDFVALFDDTLLSSIDVTGGLSLEGGILVNTPKSPEEIAGFLNGYKGKICTIDAKRISEEVLGQNFPNMAMLSALIKLSGLMGKEKFLENMEDSLKHKFATKPQVVSGNMEILKRSFEEVQGI